MLCSFCQEPRGMPVVDTDSSCNMTDNANVCILPWSSVPFAFPEVSSFLQFFKYVG